MCCENYFAIRNHKFLLWFVTGSLRIYFQSWKQAKERAMVQRLKEERATIHYSHYLLNTALRRWQVFRSMAIHKQVTQLSACLSQACPTN
jgi:hypothetical protein